jgi:hypothetical protein
MKVHSPLADLEIGIRAARRDGDDLVLESSAGGSVDALITVSAGEVLHTLGIVLGSPSALLFVLGLPFFWLRQRFGPQRSRSTAHRPQSTDINKPW